jgi:hypothetical protein
MPLHILLACVFFCIGNPPPRPDSAAITSILHLAYPGSRVIFTRSYRDTLVDKTGRRELVHVRYEYSSDPRVGALIVTFRDRGDSAVARAERGVAKPGQTSSEVLVADLSATDVASNLRRANLDDEAVATTLVDMKIHMGFLSAQHDPSEVISEYSSTYSGRGWVGGVQWNGVIEIKPKSLGVQQRVPEVVVKKALGDSTHIEGELHVDDVEPGAKSVTIHANIGTGASVTKKTVTLPWSDDRPLSGVLLLSKL